jgi:mannose-6-phosphate isomerase
MKPYPLVMDPLLKERVWGGRRLADWGKRLPPAAPIGESWEIADLSAEVAENGCSHVANGPLAGASLRGLVTEHAGMLLGTAAPAPEGGFPLLIKYLDATENLSVQVHPSPDYAAAHPEAHLKSEAWVVLDAAPGAQLYAGIREGVDAATFRADLEAGTVADDLVAIPGRAGDCHYIPSGTCHALGAGLLVAEIQPPSDTTFRLWDWGREGRELHTEQALACLDFEAPSAQGRRRAEPMLVDGLRTSTLTETDHFGVERIEAVEAAELPVVTDDMPVVWMVTAGRGRVRGGGVEVEMTPGTTILMPAALDDASAAMAAGCSLLRVTLPSPIRGAIA